MKCHLVIRVAGEPKTLSRDDLEFPVVPVVGDDVFWNDDWGGMRVEYRYVGLDYIELGLGHIGKHEVDAFIDAGWTFR
jgi:hypothetical protein